MTKPTLGREFQLWRNTSGDPNNPTWSKVTSCRDLKLTPNKKEEEVTSRGSGGYTRTITTEIDLTVNFTILDDPNDPNAAALIAAARNDQNVELAIGKGDLLGTGFDGVKAVFRLSHDEDYPVTGSAKFAIVGKVAYESYVPTYFTT